MTEDAAWRWMGLALMGCAALCWFLVGLTVGMLL